MPALIVAFDGVLADTLGLRASAISAACAEVQLGVAEHEVMPFIAGRSLDESVQEVLGAWAVRGASGAAQRDTEVRVDATTMDLVALRAQRLYAAQLSQGITLNETVREELLRYSAAGQRIVLRGDSLRRDVEPLLELSGLEYLVTMLRCADDRGPVAPVKPTALASEGPTGLPRGRHATVLRSWHAIDARLTAMQIPRMQRRALENSSQTAVLASAFVHVDAS